MKRKFLPIIVIVLCISQFLKGQDSAEVFLLTCSPGTETYSIYGHSALRIIIPSKNSDLVYNWGVFDFNTPHFVWRFAKGNLDYMLGVFSFNSFLQEYRSENRWVVSQKINFTDEEVAKLFQLISDNLKPENIKYRYDFLYDNCSTRIRDLLEKTIDSSLVYPPSEPRRKLNTFRGLIGHYQKGYPWLNYGINLILGSPVDKKADIRDRMFLPIDLMNGLTASTVRRQSKVIPLLRNPETVLNFKPQAVKETLLKTPFFIFSIVLILMVIFTAKNRKPVSNRVIDFVLFSIFSLLAVIILFLDFFTDHMETKRNFNLVWLNPVIFMCLASLIANRNWKVWFRIVFSLAVIFLAILLVVPQDFSDATFPLVIMMILRSSVRSGFSWNPLNLPYLTEF